MLTYAAICALNEQSIIKVRALKQEFDLAFETLLAVTNKKNLRQVETLQWQIQAELQAPLIARSLDRVSDKTLIYIGPLKPGIFHKLPQSIERIYTPFSEGEIRVDDIKIGGVKASDLKQLFESKQKIVNEEGRKTMENPAFTTAENAEARRLVRLTVADLGFPDGATVEEILDRAVKFGLELCPAEVGPHYCLQDLFQPIHGVTLIAMKPILNSDQEHSSIFYVEQRPPIEQRRPSGSWMDATWMAPTNKWSGQEGVAFILPKRA